jgi:YHS domain-containing protein
MDHDLADLREEFPETCAVCGKSVANGGGHVRLNQGGKMINLCCPLCMETFQDNPEKFLRRQKTKEELRTIHDLLQGKPPKAQRR